MKEKICVASDLGAGSGRIIAGRFDGARLRFEETNRFENAQTPLPGGLHWNMVALYRNILDGIRNARPLGSDPVSVGTDTCPRSDTLVCKFVFTANRASNAADGITKLSGNQTRIPAVLGK
ncbi:MAG: hypothetical protein IJ783_11180 [Kiritimatiellae bacterium]|nr:hypothetical protein [Kiritimatiellia bacterium]